MLSELPNILGIFFFLPLEIFSNVYTAFVILGLLHYSLVFIIKSELYAVLLETFKIIFHRGLFLVFHHSSVNGRYCFHASFFYFFKRGYYHIGCSSSETLFVSLSPSMQFNSDSIMLESYQV